MNIFSETTASKSTDLFTSKSSRSFWVFPVTPQHWEIVKAKSIWAVQWERIRDKIKKKDIIIFYLVGSSPPAIVGLYEVVGEWREAKTPIWTEEFEIGEIKYPWQVSLNKICIGAMDVRKNLQELSFIENKAFWGVYLRGSPGNFGRSISQADFEFISNKLSKSSIQIEVSTAKDQIEQERDEEAEREEKEAQKKGLPNHNELRDMIQDIGKMKGLVSEIEYPINGWRLDVIWRKPVRKNPDQAWEVQIGGNFYEALAKLKHAWDIWGSEPFLVTTEKYENETQKLLGGTFHEISVVMRIINYKQIMRLHQLLRDETELEKEIGLSTRL